MLPILISFLESHSQFLQPLMFLLAWLLIGLFVSTVISATVDVAKRSRKMHEIPCHSCRYCTNNYYLKCTIHPSIALTESAINCFDFQPESSIYKS